MMLRPPVRGAPVVGRVPGLVAFTVGVSAGGLFTLAAAHVLGGLLSWIPLGGRQGLAAVACLLVAAHAAGLVRLRLPQRQGMIPIERFDRRPSAAQLLFGLELGSGLRTYLPSPAPHLVVGLVLLHVVPASALPVLALGWGLGRALPLVARLGEGERGGWAGRTALSQRAALVGTWLAAVSGALVLAAG